MRKIRLGNDIIISWHINDENGDPYNLEGKDLYVELSTDKTIVPMQNYQVIGNTIIFPFYGKDQTTTGNYVALLSENKGKVGMKTIDTKKAFTLVAHTWQTGGGDSSEMTVETLDLTGVISGITVTEIYSTIAENYYNKEEVDAKMLPTIHIPVEEVENLTGATKFELAEHLRITEAELDVILSGNCKIAQVDVFYQLSGFETDEEEVTIEYSYFRVTDRIYLRAATLKFVFYPQTELYDFKDNYGKVQMIND